jgi:two-component system phosphate regulon sensor histidine kinase PhoR
MDWKIANDSYTNNRILQDYLYKEDNPISLEKVDGIFKEGVKSISEHLNYSFSITDSLGKQTAFLKHGKKGINERFVFKETIQLRNIDPEYITLTITSPYKIIFGKMSLLLIGSLILAVIVVFALTYQIRIISRQKKIAAFRQDFTHSMIHDMKNPITSIQMGISSLKSGKLDDKPQLKEHYYKIISQEGDHLLGLTNKILEIAQFEAQQVVLTKQPIRLPDLLGSLTEKYMLNTAKKIHFHIELNEVETIYADLHYLYEAFNNLIDNAVKYSKDNEDVEITITGFCNGGDIQLVFRDAGIGIPVRDQKKIFQKFERALPVIKSRKVSGFGLGLNLVFQVIKAHGGTIRVNSRLNSYSEFIINLPNENNQTVIN